MPYAFADDFSDKRGAKYEEQGIIFSYCLGECKKDQYCS